MPDIWVSALNSYSYPVDLRNFGQKQLFSGFFNKNILGDKKSTEVFEKDYQKNAPYDLAAYYEVIFWGYYSRAESRDSFTIKRIQKIKNNNIKSQQLWDSIKAFIERSNETNFRKIQQLLGLSMPVLFTPILLIALADPVNFPLVNKDVARWVNANILEHNKNRDVKLTKFVNPSSLQITDFQNYLHWRAWACETAHLLSNNTNMIWRARDVEMAIYAASKNDIILDSLSTEESQNMESFNTNSDKAKYISEIVITRLKNNDLSGANQFLNDLQNCSYGEVNLLVLKLISQIELRLDYQCDEVPIELIKLAELINHKILFGSN